MGVVSATKINNIVTLDYKYTYVIGKSTNLQLFKFLPAFETIGCDVSFFNREGGPESSVRLQRQ